MSSDELYVFGLPVLGKPSSVGPLERKEHISPNLVSDEGVSASATGGVPTSDDISVRARSALVMIKKGEVYPEICKDTLPMRYKWNSNFNSGINWKVDDLQEWKCSVCLDVPAGKVMATQGSCCGAIVCEACAVQADLLDTCPVCKSKSPAYFADRRLERTISALEVTCRCCDWDGKISEKISEKLTDANGNCLQLGRCKYKYLGCNFFGNRKEVIDHEKDEDLHLDLAMKKVSQYESLMAGEVVSVMMSQDTMESLKSVACRMGKDTQIENIFPRTYHMSFRRNEHIQHETVVASAFQNAQPHHLGEENHRQQLQPLQPQPLQPQLPRNVSIRVPGGIVGFEVAHPHPHWAIRH